MRSYQGWTRPRRSVDGVASGLGMKGTGTGVERAPWKVEGRGGAVPRLLSQTWFTLSPSQRVKTETL